MDTYFHPSPLQEFVLLALLYHALGKFMSVHSYLHHDQPHVYTKGTDMASLGPRNLSGHRCFPSFYHCVSSGVRYPSFISTPWGHLEVGNVHPSEDWCFYNIFRWCVVRRFALPIKYRSANEKLTFIYHHSLCACAAGRVTALVDMEHGEDKSYAYSQYLLWGLGEATSTILVFCAPAIPIMFNSSRRASNFKASPSWSAGQRKHPSEHRQRPWPRISSNSAAVDEYHRMHEESATHLTELGQNNSRTGSVQRQVEEHPLQSYLGILKTTEIEITTHTETDLPTIGHRQEEVRHPWRDVRASP